MTDVLAGGNADARVSPGVNEVRACGRADERVVVAGDEVVESRRAHPGVVVTIYVLGQHLGAERRLVAARRDCGIGAERVRVVRRRVEHERAHGHVAVVGIDIGAQKFGLGDIDRDAVNCRIDDGIRRNCPRPVK